MTEAVGHFLVAPSEDNVTVKINIGWCENDYQLDIALPEDPNPNLALVVIQILTQSTVNNSASNGIWL